MSKVTVSVENLDIRREEIGKSLGPEGPEPALVEYRVRPVIVVRDPTARLKYGDVAEEVEALKERAQRGLTGMAHLREAGGDGNGSD